MMRKTSQEAGGSRRERQILDILYRRGRATAAEVQAELPDAPGYSAVRTLLTLLERKGWARHEAEGPRYVYLPTVPAHKARRHALAQVVATFFGGSRASAAAALLEAGELKQAELDELARRIEEARAAARKAKE
jgi:BlaI family transcriptional regulator, penicillinase repressor